MILPEAVVGNPDDMLTNVDKAYQILLKQIIEKKLPAGEFLSQRKLSETTHTSVVSLREALKRLEGEGVLEAVPRWGVRIPVETEQDLVYRYELREVMEVLAALKISQGIDLEKAKTLRKLAAECDAIDGADTEHILEFAEKHRELHIFLAECSGNPLLAKELERLRVRSLMFQSAKTTWAKDVTNKRWKRWHRDLIEEILSGDSVRAQEAMRAHIRHGLANDLKFFNEDGKSNDQ